MRAIAMVVRNLSSGADRTKRAMARYATDKIIEMLSYADAVVQKNAAAALAELTTTSRARPPLVSAALGRQRTL